MNKRNSLLFIGLAAALIFSMSMFAQEKTEVTVQVKKDGKVIKDTTYQFDDAAEAKHALKMMEILSGDDGHQVKVIKKKMMAGDHPHGEHVFIMKSGDGETIEILMDEDEDGNIVKKKTVKVIVSGDEHGTRHVDNKELKEIEEEVYVISGDDVEVELKEIMEDHDGENVKVIVIKTKQKKQ